MHLFLFFFVAVSLISVSQHFNHITVVTDTFSISSTVKKKSNDCYWKCIN